MSFKIKPVLQFGEIEETWKKYDSILLEIWQTNFQMAKDAAYRVVLQKVYTFAGLQLGRSARERASQYRKLSAHSRTFERGAGWPAPTILGHARAFWKTRFFGFYPTILIFFPIFKKIFFQ